MKYFWAENDHGQQLGATFGRLRDDGQRDHHLLGQNGHTNYKQNDSRAMLDRRY